jgi:hypothetical protein
MAKSKEEMDTPAAEKNQNIDPSMFAMFQQWMQATVTGPVQDQLQAAKRERESIEFHEKLRAEISKPLKQSNQEKLEKQFGNCPLRFKVWMSEVDKKTGKATEPPTGEIDKFTGMPALEIPAHSEAEARGIYNQFCGIRWAQTPAHVKQL